MIIVTLWGPIGVLRIVFFRKLSDSPCSETCDVLLLTDIFEKLCVTCLAHYSLDSVHYYTAPGLAWDAALRMSRWN